MSDVMTEQPHGRLTGPTTLQIVRRLPGPIDRVWAYLTQSELRRQWLAAGDMELAAGARFELVWRNDELSDGPDPRPQGMPAENRMTCEVTDIDAPRRLAFTWSGSGEVVFELEPAGDEVLLTVTHNRLPNRETLLMVAAGWHAHLDLLVDRARGDRARGFWSNWTRLHGEYGQRLPA